MSHAKKVYLAKLAESGFTEADGRVLGMDYRTDAETKKLGPEFPALPSLYIPYFDIGGDPMVDRPGSVPYFRARKLSADPKSFSGQTEDDDRRKYIQPSGTYPCAYYPKNLEEYMGATSDEDEPVNWNEVALNHKFDIIITEGELKAAAMCKLGFPTIALGGVHSYRAAKHGIKWVDSLNDVKWKRRTVYVCYDSDYVTNPDICLAMCQISEELVQKGCDVKVMTLTSQSDSGKMGLDDFIVHHGEDALQEVLDLKLYSKPFGAARDLFLYNDRYVYIQSMSVVTQRDSLVVQRDGRTSNDLYYWNPQKFLSTFGNESMFKYELKPGTKQHPEPTWSKKKVPVPPEWLSWELRTTAAKATYEPGQPEFIEGVNSRIYNTWRGPGLEPVEGSIEPYMQFFNHITEGLHPKGKEWLLDWLAYPIQFPGSKLYSAVIMHGGQGAGKSFLGLTMRRLYGDHNFSEISQNNLESSFNEWMTNKQFVVGEEVTGNSNRKHADHVKNLITQDTVIVNQKHVQSYAIKDCVNYYFTTNHRDAFFLEDSDRRFFVHEVTADKTQFDFAAYNHWLDHQGGAAHLLHHFQQRDLSKFNPKGDAYITSSKLEMISEGKSEMDAWIEDLLNNPDDVYARDGAGSQMCDLMTAPEILDMYKNYHEDSRVHVQSMARKLAQFKFVKANKQPQGKKSAIRFTKVVGGTKTQITGSYYIMKNRPKWEKATHKQCSEYLTQFYGTKLKSVGKKAS